MADFGDMKHVAAHAILAYVHAREQGRIDAEHGVRRERLANAHTGGQAILAVLQQAIAPEFDRVAGHAPPFVGNVGGIFFDLSRLHRAVVAIEIGQHVLGKLRRPLNHTAIGWRPCDQLL